ncbi:MAG: hypothetical protein QM784_26625 [Polyangiaceae bacterium]
MHYGQPPSWRPDVEQLSVEGHRGTVRDALGGLRNLEQLLGSLRVGPRALLSVIPDVQACCAPLAAALSGLANSVASRLTEAGPIVSRLSTMASERVAALSDAFDGIGKSTFNAKARLRLEEQVVSTGRDLEAVYDLIDLLGEVAWGRTMPISLAEIAREAFRSSEPPGLAKSSIRLTLCAEIPNIERVVSPRAIVLILNQLVRWSIRKTPDLVPRVVFGMSGDNGVEVRVEAESGTGELRWAIGRYSLPEAEECLRIAARAMKLELERSDGSEQLRLLFPST